jgi:hypothetical protein
MDLRCQSKHFAGVPHATGHLLFQNDHIPRWLLQVQSAVTPS